GMSQHAPQIEIAGNATPVAERAAARVVARLRDRHAVTLGFATGATMRPIYARLVAATRAGDVSFRAVSSFNLDEYVHDTVHILCDEAAAAAIANRPHNTNWRTA